MIGTKGGDPECPGVPVDNCSDPTCVSMKVRGTDFTSSDCETGVPSNMPDKSVVTFELILVK